MRTWKYIIVLNIKGKHNFKQFYYIHIAEIPTQRENTYENVQSCPSNEKRELSQSTGLFSIYLEVLLIW